MKIYDRYAQAFFELVKTKEELLDVLNLEKLLDKEVESFLKNPVADIEHKKQVTDTIASTQALQTFLKFMLYKGRFDFLAFVKAFEKLSDQKNQIVRGKVTTAVEFSLVARKQLEDTFLKKLNKKVIFKYEINKAVLGGIRAEIEGTVFEDTLANKLNKFKNI